MKTSVEKLDDTHVRLTITRSAEEVDEFVGNVYARLAKDIKHDGFRPGKLPRPIIDQDVGRENVLDTVRRELMEESGPDAVDELDLMVRHIDAEPPAELVEHEEFTFRAVATVRPEMEIDSVEGLTVTVPPISASEEDVDAEIGILQNQFANLKPVESRGISASDFVLLSFNGMVDGKTADDLMADKIMYEMGQGNMPEGFDEALLGAKSGESVHVEFDVPETAKNPDYHGKRAAFEVEVHEIKEKELLPLDDKFAETVGGFSSMEELREDIRKALVDVMQGPRQRQIDHQAAEAIAAKLKGDVPDELIVERKQRMRGRFMDELQQREKTLEQLFEETGITEEKLDEEMERQAAEIERQFLALEAVFRNEGLEVTFEDLDSAIGAAAESEGTTADEMRAQIMDEGMLPLLKQEVMHAKALRWVVEHTEVIEEMPKPEVEGTAAKKGKSQAKKGAAAAKPTAAKAAAKKPAAKTTGAKTAAAKKPATTKRASAEKPEKAKESD